MTSAANNDRRTTGGERRLIVPDEYEAAWEVEKTRRAPPSHAPASVTQIGPSAFAATRARKKTGKLP